MNIGLIPPKKSRAQAMVEFAVVLPLLLVLSYGLLEAGRLLFVYSSIVTAARQAVRYGSATGEGTTPGIPRYQDCQGIRQAAQRADFLNAFDDVDIVISHDTGPGTTLVPYCGGDPVASPPPASDNYRPVGNNERLVVEIRGDFLPLVPRVVPLVARTAAGGNPILGISARTILTGVSIQITPAGSVTGQATATVPNGTSVSNTATATLSPVGQPQLQLAKSASTEYAASGGTVVYTFTLTNTGNVPLTSSAISDPKLGGSIPGCGANLAVGASFSCTASYVVTSNDVNAETVVNTATATALYGSQTVTSNQASATLYTGALFLRPSASPSSVSQPNQTVTYSYQIINNTGATLYPPYTLSGHRGTENCSAATGAISPGAGLTCTGTYTVTQTDLETTASLANSNITATACTMSNNCSGPKKVTSNTASASVTLVRNPAISMAIISAGPSPSTTLNALLTYTYALTNTGNVTLSSLAITDTVITGITCPASLAPGATQNCTGTHSVTQAELDAGSITNQATASAAFANQNVSSTSQSVTVITYAGPRLKLQITPNPTSYTGSGQFIVYTYRLTNTGDRPLYKPYAISDSKVTPIDCAPATSPLAPGSSTNCVGSYATTEADMNAGQIQNSANASASDGTQTITSNSAMAVVYVPGAPTLTPSPTNTGLPTPTPTFTPTAITPVCTAAPVTLTASADSWIDQDNPTTNNGSATTLTVQSRNNRNQRALVNFSLPSLPAGCVIQSATLRLYASAPVAGRTLQALQVSSSWTENGVNWNNQPSTTGAAATTASGSATGYREWTVTSIVQAIYGGTNNGFLIRDASEDANGQGVDQQFQSRENTNKPQLVITYSPGP